MITILRKRMTEDLRIRNYSIHTIDAYIRCVANFARHFGKSPDLLGAEQVRKYQIYLVEIKKASWSLFNQTVCALRFLYENTLDRPGMVKYIPFPKQEKKLPVILSFEELKEFFRSVHIPKHQTIVKLMYATGLRISEALSLMIEDIDSMRMVIRVRLGKGKKDRYVPLPPTLLDDLRRYWKAYRPEFWLFPGESGKLPLSGTALQRVVLKARRKAGFHKPVTCHTMRHCYATHQLEAGTDLRTLQLRLGHRSLNTTALYLHVAVGASQSTNEITDLLQRLNNDETDR